PIIFGDRGVRATLTRTGMAVGLEPNTPFRTGKAQLAPGETLLAFTDGVLDAQNSNGESFGEERLLSLVQPPAASAAALIDRMDTHLREHIAGASQFDDITMLVVQRLNQ
ncbi:MAG: serine/threonine-protein phosphatase, partial [Chloroflexota bacterium]|nr:serine/threonine-protein phosphatase [Chloroflexota bacterium]